MYIFRHVILGLLTIVIFVGNGCVSAISCVSCIIYLVTQPLHYLIHCHLIYRLSGCN